jgi:hypothetical protein
LASTTVKRSTLASDMAHEGPGVGRDRLLALHEQDLAQREGSRLTAEGAIDPVGLEEEPLAGEEEASRDVATGVLLAVRGLLPDQRLARRQRGALHPDAHATF